MNRLAELPDRELYRREYRDEPPAGAIRGTCQTARISEIETMQVGIHEVKSRDAQGDGTHVISDFGLIISDLQTGYCRLVISDLLTHEILHHSRLVPPWRGSG